MGEITSQQVVSGSPTAWVRGGSGSVRQAGEVGSSSCTSCGLLGPCHSQAGAWVPFLRSHQPPVRPQGSLTLVPHFPYIRSPLGLVSGRKNAWRLKLRSPPPCCRDHSQGEPRSGGGGCRDLGVSLPCSVLYRASGGVVKVPQAIALFMERVTSPAELGVYPGVAGNVVTHQSR